MFATSFQDAKFLDGRVRNVNLVSDYDEITRVQLRVQQICGREVGSTGGTSGFPGGQPVSLTFDNLHLLSRQRYKVSWKADGLRYMMFIEGRGQVYMIDRDNTVFHVPNLLFPFRKDHSKHLENTLIDGVSSSALLSTIAQSFFQTSVCSFLASLRIRTIDILIVSVLQPLL